MHISSFNTFAIFFMQHQGKYIDSICLVKPVWMITLALMRLRRIPSPSEPFGNAAGQDVSALNRKKRCWGGPEEAQ